MITRFLEEQLKNVSTDKAIVLLGARQAGKTTLIERVFGKGGDTLWLNGDDSDVRDLFENISSTRLKALIGEHKTLVVDEAQRIADIGLKLKLVTDAIPGVRLVASGSSSFDLANKLNEPLTGRKREFILYPISFGEMVAHHGLLDELRLLPHRLVFGYYPEVVSCPGEEREALHELSESYLYKDILTLEKIKKSERLTRLLKALAYQVGSQVSFSELSRLCGLDAKTVEKYITVLEQAYIIFRLASFSRNLRNELKASRKIYFWDNGIRNAVVADFRAAENRDDVGKLWENFVISERLKRNEYIRRFANCWFWRTQQQQEVDYIEELDGELRAWEFNWNPMAKLKHPKVFLSAYPDCSFEVIHRENIADFLLENP
ncbi:MAG: ATP-binding protein [Fusobacteriaceae bacterium]|jgi:predicted AAA+ superfamily ATPase|nr:ATP-binding protein [Fusobacteriaceae bacterium]